MDLINLIIKLRLCISFIVSIIFGIMSPAFIKLQAHFRPEMLSILLCLPAVIKLSSSFFTRVLNINYKLWIPVIMDCIFCVLYILLLFLHRLNIYVVLAIIFGGLLFTLYMVRSSLITDLLKKHIKVDNFLCDIVSVCAFGSIVGYLIGACLYNLFTIYTVLIICEIISICIIPLIIIENKKVLELQLWLM